MEFGLLGPLTVVDGGRRVPIQSAKHRILLAALLLRAGELVTLDELVEAIWGDALQADPRRVVQTYVARLRKLLGGTELIQSRPEGYAIAVAPGDVDVHRFEMLLEQARDAAGAEDRHAEAEMLRQALAHLHESLAIFQELGDSPSEAKSLHELGVTLRAVGRTQQARAHWLRALAIYERLQAAEAATQVRTLLAELPCPASPQVRALQSRESR